MNDINEERLEAIARVPFYGPIWANAIGTWLAYVDAMNLLNFRQDEIVASVLRSNEAKAVSAPVASRAADLEQVPFQQAA